jgi:outer membrane protein assembly factor BamB
LKVAGETVLRAPSYSFPSSYNQHVRIRQPRGYPQGAKTAQAARNKDVRETNRGVALYGDKVFYAAGEAVLVALDAKTGEEVWTTTVADNRAGYYITLGLRPEPGRDQNGAAPARP